MTFIRFNYIRPGKGVKKRAVASLDYIAHRAGKEKERMERMLFTNRYTLTEEQAKRMIAEAPKNTYYWRMKYSPDPNGANKEKNLDLWKLTRQMVQFLEKRLGNREIQLIGTEHNDHTDIPHIHAILLIQRRGREMLITPEIIEEVQTLIARLELKQGQGRTKAREFVKDGRSRRHPYRQRGSGIAADRPRRLRGHGIAGGFQPPMCRKCETTMIKLAPRHYKCPNCGLERGRHAQRKIRTQRGIQAGLGL